MCSHFICKISVVIETLHIVLFRKWGVINHLNMSISCFNGLSVRLWWDSSNFCCSADILSGSLIDLPIQMIDDTWPHFKTKQCVKSQLLLRLSEWNATSQYVDSNFLIIQLIKPSRIQSESSYLINLCACEITFLHRVWIFVL